MTCPGCKEAQDNPENWEIFYDNCLSCEARSLIRHDEFKESLEAKRWTKAYGTLLNRIFGSGADRGHAMAKEWHRRLNGGKDAA